MHSTIIIPEKGAAPIPDYLHELYWWAYVHPWAPRVFDHQWTVNSILVGNYNRLRNMALQEFTDNASGRTLQVGACYGNMTPHLAKKILKSGGTLDVVDVVPMQLENLHKKLPPEAPVRLLLMDAAALDIPDHTYDNVLIFLLLHEQPQNYRERTLHEALRVLKPGGKIVIVDYGQPAWWHPMRYSLLLLYALLKPPAVAVWNNAMRDVLPVQMAGRTWTQTSYFGGLFQKLVSTSALASHQ